ncbi:hypothetical protein HanPI659440_Chr13g0510431 [Helianthus annuus]|nr:hypothetical protein HanPI659440_Chr13g0510431 [Helianthus annuus]
MLLQLVPVPKDCEMAESRRNITDVFRATKPQGGFKPGCGKLGAPIGQNRRALSEINKNIITGPTAYPFANVLPGAINAHVTTKPSLPLSEGKKPKIQTIAIATDNEDCSIIDLEEDFNAPMFVQHTESMLEDIKKSLSKL